MYEIYSRFPNGVAIMLGDDNGAPALAVKGTQSSFPSGVTNMLHLFHHLSEKNRGACKLSWVCWAGQLQGKGLEKKYKTTTKN